MFTAGATAVGYRATSLTRAAGYCAGYLCCWGYADRHNDNMHGLQDWSAVPAAADFGRILGNAQMFGSIKRDRVPFVLTPDMAYVINAGDKPSARFQKFTGLCCTAYNELRRLLSPTAQYNCSLVSCVGVVWAWSLFVSDAVR